MRRKYNYFMKKPRKMLAEMKIIRTFAALLEESTS